LFDNYETARARDMLSDDQFTELRTDI